MNKMKDNATSLCRFVVMAFIACLPWSMVAQDFVHVRTHLQDSYWDFPYAVDQVNYFDFTSNQSHLQVHVKGDLVVPFVAAQVDTLLFQNQSLSLSANKYQVFPMYITTLEDSPINSKEDYVSCYVSVNGRQCFPDYSGMASIRGRGNSTWLWYDKKPYRLKLSKKSALLGLAEDKDWVLLANYRDVTDLMNTFVFEAGEWLGMPCTPHSRYLELFVNGDYAGVYQLTEQVEQGEGRVSIDKQRGLLLSFDKDDGPELSPQATDNFWSSVFSLPVCVKYPKLTAGQNSLKDSIRQEFAQLETLIRNKDYSAVEAQMDLMSFVHYLMLQELVMNVELVAPRSVFIFKDGEGKWTMGPLWDFDAGYDFDWSSMTTGHNYFDNYKELVLGTDPYHHVGGYDSQLSSFFTQLFGCPQFVSLYKSEWERVRPTLVPTVWSTMEQYLEGLNSGPMQREFTRWPLWKKDFRTEVYAMHTWLLNRVNYLDGIIRGYPDRR